MRTSSEYLEHATKYDVLAAQTTKQRRQFEHENLAEVYRYFAKQAAVATRLAPEAI